MDLCTIRIVKYKLNGTDQTMSLEIETAFESPKESPPTGSLRQRNLVRVVWKILSEAFSSNGRERLDNDETII